MRGENEREAEAEERPGERDDDLLPGRGGRQFLARRVGLALDGFHRRHLRQRDVAAGGDRSRGCIRRRRFSWTKAACRTRWRTCRSSARTISRRGNGPARGR